MSEEKRRGVFTISGELLRKGDMKILRKLMENVVVYHIEPRFDTDEVKYFAVHPTFDVVEDGCIYPEYVPILSYLGKELSSVEWRKL